MTARRKRIALIAHDNLKPDITRHDLFGTGTTGGMIAGELGLTVHRFRSGPLMDEEYERRLPDLDGLM
jgi:methylglyoxal synthase